MLGVQYVESCFLDPGARATLSRLRKQGGGRAEALEWFELWISIFGLGFLTIDWEVSKGIPWGSGTRQFCSGRHHHHTPNIPAFQPEAQLVLIMGARFPLVKGSCQAVTET